MRFAQKALFSLLVAVTSAGFLFTEAFGQTTGRHHHTTTLLPDGNILIVGGATAADVPMTSVEIRRSTDTSYATAGSLNIQRASHTATLLPDGRVLVVGGCSNTGGNCNATITATAETYDPRVNTWTAVGSLTTARYNHTATLMPNGKVLVAAGQTSAAGTVTATCEIFNPATNLFEACASMSLARAGHTATLLHNGRVFVAGGYLGSGFAVSTEIYDPAANVWAAGPSLIQKRAYHTATQMGHQKVLIVGGYNAKNFEENRGFLQTAEIYDPTANSITPAGSMNLRRKDHSATLHADGSVHIGHGLTNMVTTYLSGPFIFEEGSRLAMSFIGGDDTTTTLNPIGSTLTINMDGVQLSVPAAGRILDGEIDYTGANAAIDVAAITWPSPLTAAPLTGTVLDGNNGMVGNVSISQFNGGSAVFSSQNAVAEDSFAPRIRLNSVLPVSINGGGGSVPASGTANLTNATMTLDNLVIAAPESAISGQTTLRGKLTITGGTIDATTDAAFPFQIELTGGETATSGVSQTVTTINGSNFVSLSGIVFSSVQGTITNSTDTAISEAQLESVLESNPQKLLSGLNFIAQFTLSLVDMSGVSMNVIVATVAVREILSADVEAYSPIDNEWDFVGGTRYSLTGVSSLLSPEKDELFFGGVACNTQATCGAKTFFAPSTLVNKNPLDATITRTVNWNASKDLARARSNHSSTLLPDGRLLAAGGNDGADVVAVGELYQRDTDTWTDTLPMKLPRSHHAATLLTDGTVLVTGGFTTAASTGATNAAEIFYPASNAWVETSPMISSRSFHTTMLLPDGNVLAAGGFADGTYLDTAEIYISTQHVWVPVASLDTERAQHVMSLLHDGRVFVSGGVNAGGVLGAGVTAGQSPGQVGSEIFDPATRTWSRVTAGMNTERYSHTATVLQDGRILLAGGDDGFGEVSRAETYDPVTNTWTLTSATGNDMLVPRLGHTATLMPGGSVLITGGFTALGGAIIQNESYHIAVSSWGGEGTLTNARGDHTTSLLPDGTVLVVGGLSGSTALSKVEETHFGGTPDLNTPTNGLRRRPNITASDRGNYLPGSRVTVTGNDFRGRTEGSGGSGGSGNSSFHHPRILMERIGASGISSSNDSAFLLDLSSGVYLNQLVSWTNIDSSITFMLPETQATLPRGWYSLRVGANGQFSDSKVVQVAPDKPTLTPGTPSGAIVGSSSVTWTWTGVGGTVGVDFDGYAVYSATSGVFIATVAHAGAPGSPQVFLHENLGPDTSDMIRVAAYNIAGDGPVAVATVPVLTPDSEVANLVGTPQSPTEIFWSWAGVNQATSYEIRHASNAALLGTSTIPSFTQTGLSTNTAYGVRVRAILPGGNGELSGATTVYTTAALPIVGSPPVTNVSTGGFTVLWRDNQNPPGTGYVLRYLQQLAETKTTLSASTALDATLGGLPPNTSFELEVQAVNGDGVGTGFTQLGTTVTLASVPGSPVVTINEPSLVTITWDANGNHSLTEYQVLYSSDNFVSHFSTFSTFGSEFYLTTATISNLITGQNYTFRVSAFDQFGRETGQTSTATVTNNGGGPAGSIAFAVPVQGITIAGGTLGATAAEGILREVSFRIPPHAFPNHTQIFVTTSSAKHCGGIDAEITITPVPSLQPDYPFEMSIKYVTGEANLGSVATLGIVRWDPVSSTCVPLPSVVDQASKKVTAQINHLSTFQLAQLSPQSNIDNSRIFPNPLYKTRNGFFTFDRMPANARIRIYTIHGGEVHETMTNASGVATWDATNKVGRPVASGLYIAVIESGGTKKKSKLVVIR